MGLPQNETNLFSLLSSPAKRSIFSVHKVKWHFPPGTLMPCQVPPEMLQADLGVTSVCVLSEKETSEGRSKQWDIHISTPLCLRGLLLWGDSCFENVSGESQRDIRLETWVFCLYMNQQASSDRWEMTRKLFIMNSSFFSPFEWYFELLYLYCAAQWVIWFFKVNLEQNSTHTLTKWLVGLP